MVSLSLFLFGMSCVQVKPVVVAKPSVKPVLVGDGYKGILILAGSFQMGCTSGDSDCYNLEKPTHKVSISKDFYTLYALRV